MGLTRLRRVSGLAGGVLPNCHQAGLDRHPANRAEHGVQVPGRRISDLLLCMAVRWCLAAGAARPRVAVSGSGGGLVFKAAW